MQRQLIVCCDGTNNNLTGRERDTHVVRLVELLAADPPAGGATERIVFYDAGVGHAETLGGTTVTEWFRRRTERVQALAFGQGVFDNISEAYLFLMQHYQPGDQLFFFGFSRGAFTARSVAGMVNGFGIPMAHQASMLPTLMNLYFSQRDGAYTAVAQQAQALLVAPDRQRVPIQFVGVWDTVASVGLWPFALQFTARPQAAGKAFVHVRHALALDDHRSPFDARLYEDANGPIATREPGVMGSMQQVWFRGAHGDVGGGYPWPESGAAASALGWLVSEAVQCGLRLKAQGQPLDTEARVLSALDTLAPEGQAPRDHWLHDELADAPLWALAGQHVRPGERGDEHPSVGARQPDWARDTAWGRRHLGRGFWAALALLPLFYLWMGLLLTGFGRGLGAATDTLANLGTIALAPGQWVLNLASFGALAGPSFLGEPAPFSALLVELGFIACYCMVLAPLAVRGFARWAGLRRLADAPAPHLNRLGQALPLLLLADLLGNACSALALYAEGTGLDWLVPLGRWAAGLLVWVQAVGLGGTLLLCLRAWR